MQADSCSSDPSKEKTYFKRNRVCNLHSKAEQVHVTPLSKSPPYARSCVSRNFEQLFLMCSGPETGSLVQSDGVANLLTGGSLAELS